MFRLRTLGAVELRGADEQEPTSVLLHAKPLALLVFLAAARPFGFHRRDALVGLLWPVLDQEHARGALRKTIHRLRRQIGVASLVLAGDEAIGVTSDALWCDARAFAEAERAGRAVDAVTLYRGDFLPGLFVANAPEFERWVDGERRRLRESAVRLAWLAVSEAERDGDLTESVRRARHAVSLAPDDEQGVRRLIAILERAGDRAGAIRAYGDLERYLAAELQVAPSLATSTLIARVRSESGSPPAPPTGAPPRIVPPRRR